jgi:hypothetical protein
VTDASPLLRGWHRCRRRYVNIRRIARDVRKAFSDIQLTMLVTLVLVVGVICLPYNGSATSPRWRCRSRFSTFAVMKMFNFSLDNLSMMALIPRLVFVDDAIVMLENIVRHIGGGRGPFDAALAGAREVGFTITMTTSPGGLHPDSLHGGFSTGCSASCGDHHHRDPHLRRRLGHVDADACSGS